MKKVIIIVLLASIIGNIIQFVQYAGLNRKFSEISSELDKTFEYMDTLTVDSFIEKIEAGETMCVYIGRATCNDCNLFERILKDVVNTYDFRIPTFYVSVEQYRKSNMERWEVFKKNYNFSQTPAFLLYKESKFIDSIEWNNDGISENELVEWLKKNNVI